MSTAINLVSSPALASTFNVSVFDSDLPQGCHVVNKVLAVPWNKLGDVIIGSSWSPSLFKDQKRNNDNFQEVGVLALDVDGECTLQEAQKYFADYECIIATTKSHQQLKNGIACDRFRVVIPFSEVITDSDTYQATWQDAKTKWPFIDKACKDVARFYFKSNQVVWQNSGYTFLVKKNVASVSGRYISQQFYQGVPSLHQKGVLSIATKNFLGNGAPAGQWNTSLFKAAKDFYEQGYTEDEFIKSATNISNFLDASDVRTIESAFSKPPKYAPRTKDKKIPVEVWIGEWLKKNEVSLDYKSQSLGVNGKEMTLDKVLSRLALDCDKEGRKISDSMFGHGMKSWIASQEEETVERIKNKITYDGTDDSLLRQWLAAVTGKCDSIELAIMKHFIWQVKRKLNGLQVGHHIMPLFVGRTRGGKSVALNHFLSPIEDIVQAPSSMTCISDDREAMLFNRAYVVFFDEMAKAQKVDIDSLKNLITAPNRTQRIMRTTSHSTFKNNSTLIGASNREIQELIYDPTSAGRFYQINTNDKLDWATINSLDYLAIWKSVDETSLSPIDNVIDEVHSIQDSNFRTKDPIEEFLTEWCAYVDSSNKSLWSKRDSLYGAYKSWMKYQEKKIVGIEKFSRGLTGYLDKLKIGDGIFTKVKDSEGTVRFNVSAKKFEFQ